MLSFQKYFLFSSKTFDLLGYPGLLRFMFVVSSLNRIFFILTGQRTTYTSRMSSKFGLIRPWTAELAALERMEIIRSLTMGEIVSVVV